MLRKNKIAFIIHGFPMGGAEKFLISIVNKFNETAEFQPIVVSLSKEDRLLGEVAKEVKCITITREFRWDISVSLKIRNFIKKEKITKVFCINGYSFFLAKLALIFDNRIKFYLSIHSTVPSSLKNRWLTFMYFKFVSRKDAIIYICNSQKSYFREVYRPQAGFQPIVYNGIDTSYFNPSLFTNLDICKERSTYNISMDEKIIINVARISPEKGQLDAIDALKILHEDYRQKSHLLFIGDGEAKYAEYVTGHARKNRLEKYVHFIGNQHDVRKFYCISDLFTLTSSNIETFSLAALEAMAFGLPCSLTDIGGAKEMMVEGLTGSLCRPRDCISIAGSWNYLLAANLKGEKIRRFVVDNFTSEKMFQKYFELLAVN